VRLSLIVRRSALGAVLLVLAGGVPAYAAGAGHVAGFAPADILGIGHLVGSVFRSIGHAVLGAFSWTFKLASDFILTTIGAVVKLLIPRSWAREGVQIMRWIVEVPDYAGTITSPTRQHSYGFAGINALRDLFTWIGAALLPLTLVYATSRAAIGHGDPVAVPIVRVLGLGAVLLSYPYWWSQAAAINQMTYLVLSLQPVVSGLHKLMLYAVDGAVLGGWQLIDLVLMAAVAIQLLALIFLKVAIILLGALLYAAGPVTIGLIPTDAGAAITRAWASAVGAFLLLPVAWAAVFAVGALLINDAGTAGPLIAGQSDIGSLLGGVLVAVAGLASLWLCLRAAREAGGLLRVQLGGLLAVAHPGRGSSASLAGAGRAIQAGSAAQSIRGFQSRLGEARGAAVGALASSGTAGARIARAGGVVGGLGRRGALGSAAIAAGRVGAAHGAPAAAGLIGRSRAGAVAVQMARAGTASWQSTGPRSTPSAGGEPAPAGASNRGANSAATAHATSASSASRGAASSVREPASAGGAMPRPSVGVPAASGPSFTRPTSRPSPDAPSPGPANARPSAAPSMGRGGRGAASPPRKNTPPKNPGPKKR